MKRKYVAISFEKQFLDNLVEDESSCVEIQEQNYHLALHPYHMGKLSESIKENLNKGIAKYDKTLGGILLGYQNIKLLSQIGAVNLDSFFIHINIAASFYLFKPEVGQILTGNVNKKSRDHVGCLVHNTFNVSLPKPEDDADSDDEWLGLSVEIGQDILIRITFTDFEGRLPYIRAHLISILTEQDSGISTSEENVEKPKATRIVFDSNSEDDVPIKKKKKKEESDDETPVKRKKHKHKSHKNDIELEHSENEAEAVTEKRSRRSKKQQQDLHYDEEINLESKQVKKKKKSKHKHDLVNDTAIWEDQKEEAENEDYCVKKKKKKKHKNRSHEESEDASKHEDLDKSKKKGKHKHDSHEESTEKIDIELDTSSKKNKKSKHKNSLQNLTDSLLQEAMNVSENQDKDKKKKKKKKVRAEHEDNLDISLPELNLSSLFNECSPISSLTPKGNYVMADNEDKRSKNCTSVSNTMLWDSTFVFPPDSDLENAAKNVDTSTKHKKRKRKRSVCSEDYEIPKKKKHKSDKN